MTKAHRSKIGQNYNSLVFHDRFEDFLFLEMIISLAKSFHKIGILVWHNIFDSLPIIGTDVQQMYSNAKRLLFMFLHNFDPELKGRGSLCWSNKGPLCGLGNQSNWHLRAKGLSQYCYHKSYFPPSSWPCHFDSNESEPERKQINLVFQHSVLQACLFPLAKTHSSYRTRNNTTLVKVLLLQWINILKCFLFSFIQ